MQCLFCQDHLTSLTSWQSFFLLDITERRICLRCERKLEKITGNICMTCGRPLDNLSTDFYRNNVCNDCLRWDMQPEMKDIFEKNRSIYLYNDFMKEILARYKFRGDHELVFAFQSEFQAAFKRFYSPTLTIVPIPLSKERLFERGFNQSESLANLLNYPITHLLERPHLEKQSKKSRNQRIHSENIFLLKESTDVFDKNILLIDDIYTTGTTLRHAAFVLRKAGAKSVSSLTLIRG